MPDEEDSFRIRNAELTGNHIARKNITVAVNFGSDSPRFSVAAEAASTIEEGARLAEQAIDSGAARVAMERFVAKTVELAPQLQA